MRPGSYLPLLEVCRSTQPRRLSLQTTIGSQWSAHKEDTDLFLLLRTTRYYVNEGSSDIDPRERQ